MSALLWFLVGTSSLLVMWVFFLAYSALRVKWSTLSLEVKIIGGCVIAIGWLIDLAWNWTFGLLLGITPDWTLSQKCGRLKFGEDWRQPIACYLCKRWLDPFEVGGHCKQ